MAVQITIIKYHYGKSTLSNNTRGKYTYYNFILCEDLEHHSQLYQQKIIMLTIQNAPTASAIFSANLGIDSSAICIILCMKIKDDINNGLCQKH